MKKITLTVAMLLAGYYVFAQSSSSTVNEQGDYNRAIVDQTGKHTSTILQKSNAASSASENLATVTQANIPVFGTKESSSKVEQYGRSHISTVLQTGRNSLEAYIGSDGTTPDANVDNETYAKQYGSDNTAKQIVRGAAASQSYLSLTQGGKDNNAHQIASWSVLSKGYVDQSGNRNDAWQQVDGTRDEAHLTQNGDDNYAYQWIEGGGSADNVSKILQVGTSNIAREVTNGDNNDFNISQLGNSNKLLGLSGGLYTNAEQTGDGNKALLTQAGDFNEFWVDQNGNNNSIKGTTASGALQLGNYNKAVFSQDGDDLKIVSKQIGTSNYEIVTQTGDGSSSVVKQTGGMNSSNVVQSNNP